MIAERIFTINGDDAYLCDILHDIGLIVEMEGDPEIFLRLIDQLTPDDSSITDVEQQLFNTDHGQIGYILAKEWRIPDAIAEAIRDHHHKNGDIDPKSPAEAYCK